MTRREHAIFWLVALVSAASRFLAMSRTLWEWDEVLFSHALRDYDVALHHPHPPGFPVYIAAAKLLRVVIDSDFRALQAINLIAGVLLFPAMFVLARELGFRFSTAILASSLLVFFPNVWFFGGGAFSDIPSLTLVLFALTLLFRGWRSRNAFWAGTLLLALAVGIRPQNLIIGLFAGIVATIIRGRESIRAVLVALLIGVVVVFGAYAGAMYAGSGPESFLGSVRAHRDYIASVDSFRSPDRPSLWRIFVLFFMKQYQSPVLNVIISIFVLISAVGSIRDRNRSIGYVVASFAPFAILAWLMLDRFSVTRFSIGYAPMFAFLAADGISRAVRHDERWEWLTGAFLIAAFITYTLPSLGPVRNEVTPPVQAVAAVKQTFDPAHDRLFVGTTMTAFVDYFLPGVPYTRIDDDRGLPLSVVNSRALLLSEPAEPTPPASGRFFQRPRNSLWNIARRHYFEVVLEPISGFPDFLSGWHPPEHFDHDEWRWMAGQSVTMLPPAPAKARLRLGMSIPPALLPQGPTITIKLNGKVLDRFVAAEDSFTREFETQAAAAGAPNLLELSTDHTAWDSPSGRERGIRLQWLSWGR